MHTQTKLIQIALLGALLLTHSISQAEEVPATLVAMTDTNAELTDRHVSTDTVNEAQNSELSAALEAEIRADLARRLASEMTASLKKGEH